MAVARRPGLCHEIQNWPRNNAGDTNGCNQKVGWLCVAVCDTLEVHEPQGRYKLSNQGSSYIISQRFNLIRLQRVINEDDRVRRFFTTDRFLSNFST